MDGKQHLENDGSGSDQMSKSSNASVEAQNEEPRISKSELQLRLERCFWKYARTLSHNPHHYTLRDKWTDGSFDEIVEAVRHYSVDERFGKTIYQICYLGNFKYWSMGAPIEETILINKKQINFAKK